MSKSSLGRGLASLIPPKETPLEKVKKEVEQGKSKPLGFVQGKESVFSIEIEKIRTNPHQPRADFNEEQLADLAASIREHGILQPLLVSKNETEVPGGTRVEYQLIAGERRLRAARTAGLSQVPVIIRPVPSERQKLEWALIENIQRQDLNPLEKALAFEKLMSEFGFSQKEVAERVGKSREAIANVVRLLGLPAEIQRALRAGQIFEGHARAILAVQSLQQQTALFNEIVSKNLSVRLSEELARRFSVGRQEKNSAARKDPEVRELESRLEEMLGTKVDISKKGEKGKIVIGFYSQDELNGIVDKIID